MSILIYFILFFTKNTDILYVYYTYKYISWYTYLFIYTISVIL